MILSKSTPRLAAAAADYFRPAALRRRPKMTSAHGSRYDSVREHEMRSDRGSRKGETERWWGRAVWLGGETFVKGGPYM